MMQREDKQLPPVYLQTTKLNHSRSSRPCLQVVDPQEQTHTLLFTPSSDAREFSWQSQTWYKFTNLIRLDNLGDGLPRCPSCQGLEVAARDDVQEAVELLTGMSGTNQLFATSAVTVSAVGADEWIQPLRSEEAVPLRWRCSECKESIGTATENTDRTEDVVDETLADRIVSTIHDSHSAPRPDTVGFRSQQQKTSLLHLLEQGEVPDSDCINIQALLSGYDCETGVPDTTRLDSLYPTVEAANINNSLNNRMEFFGGIDIQSRTFDWARGRPTVNLVIALDISGSMAAPFDTDTAQRSPTKGRTEKSKLDHISVALTNFIQRLNEQDSLGVVLFNAESKTRKPVGPVTADTANTLKAQLAQTNAMGNTDILAGYQIAAEMLQQHDAETGPETENRILLISDTLPNRSAGIVDRFVSTCNSLAKNGIGTTVLGLGLHNSSIASEVCQSTGSNIALLPDATHVRKAIQRRVDSLLFPVAYDLTIELDHRVTAFLPEADGPLAHTQFRRATLFAPGPTRQSLESVVFQFPERVDACSVELSWRNRAGQYQTATRSLKWTGEPSAEFGSEDMRKRVALYRYVRVIRKWCEQMTQAEQGFAGSHLETAETAQLQNEITAVRDNLHSVMEQNDEYQFEKALNILNTMLDTI